VVLTSQLKEGNRYMARTIAGVKAVNTTIIVPVPMAVRQYRTTDGKRHDTLLAANAAQKRLNNRQRTDAIRKLLVQAGVTVPSCRSLVSAKSLADALANNPRFIGQLFAVAG
jgi:hypothetical protein